MKAETINVTFQIHFTFDESWKLETERFYTHYLNDVVRSQVPEFHHITTVMDGALVTYVVDAAPKELIDDVTKRTEILIQKYLDNV